MYNTATHPVGTVSELLYLVPASSLDHCRYMTRVRKFRGTLQRPLEVEGVEERAHLAGMLIQGIGSRSTQPCQFAFVKKHTTVITLLLVGFELEVGFSSLDG